MLALSQQRMRSFSIYNVLMTPNLIRLTDLTQTMVSYMKDLGIKETKESSKTHLRRKLEAEFGSLLQFEDLLGNNRVFIIPVNLSRLQLAKEVARLQQLQCEGQASLMDDIRRVALEVRKAICCKENDMSWPPKPSQLTEEEINLPDEVRVFLATLIVNRKFKVYRRTVLMKSPAACQLVWTGHGIWSDCRPKEASKTYITTLCCQGLDK